MARVLLVIPHDRFNDSEYQVMFRELSQAGHIVEVGSSHHTEAEGHFGLLVKPDINITMVEPTDYDALVFIGGRGVEEYLSESDVLTKIRNVFYERKLVAALGMAVEIFAQAGIISGKRVTCDIQTIPKVQYAGGYYTGSLVEEDDNLITGTGESAKEEFAKTVCAALEYENHLRELRHARVAGS